MTSKKIFLTISLSLFLVACSSTSSTQFYLLKAINPENIEINRPQLKNLTILLKPIKFPEYLDRPQMVTRDSTYKLKLSENHRWAEPLSNEFSRVLIKNLSNRITPNHILEYSELNGLQPDIHLSITVLRLDINEDNQAVLSVKWSYWTENKAAIKRFSNEYSVPIKDKTYESRVEAQSQAIALFTDAVVESLWPLYKTSGQYKQKNEEER